MGYVRKAVCNICGASKNEGNKWLGGTLRLDPDDTRPAQFQALVMREEDVARWSEEAREGARVWCGVPCLLKDAQTSLALLAGHEGAGVRRIGEGESAGTCLAKMRSLQ
jgi:hypothetical protein